VKISFANLTEQYSQHMADGHHGSADGTSQCWPETLDRRKSCSSFVCPSTVKQQANAVKRGSLACSPLLPAILLTLRLQCYRYIAQLQLEQWNSTSIDMRVGNYENPMDPRWVQLQQQQQQQA
jgi:hypothetical protein